ncbi:unnamed protein product [Phytophthora fragariaefolia]|uniref:Unnamed protein product n=1 Tax=Phytophthora fragariaefolia TaxID=1490495 RepID=A0A9W6TUF8_9STRA|nr:unnamed protein product [Phytophthora fragariaefolia]
MTWNTSSTTSSSRRSGARLERPLRTSPEDDTSLTVVMSGVLRPHGMGIDGTATTDTDADMTVEWTTPVIHRMRALVQGAVNDARTRILLDMLV